METSGYAYCACRDCMNVAIGHVGIALCFECEDADCVPITAYHADAFLVGDFDCQAEAARDQKGF